MPTASPRRPSRETTVRVVNLTGILALVFALAWHSPSANAQDANAQDDEPRPPAFIKTYLDLVAELDALYASQTTFRFKIDSEVLVARYNELLMSDMEKGFVVRVIDLDYIDDDRARIEYELIEGVPDNERRQGVEGKFAIVATMDPDDAYLVEPGSRLEIRGTPRIMFRPSPSQTLSDRFQESEIAGWQKDRHSCYLLIDNASAHLIR